ncbi:MAG: hypothetical protein JWM74_5766 [Myxococcaceae bacterium]|nr:hypothetical protein [Myxococcaceae bacterium]
MNKHVRTGTAAAIALAGLAAVAACHDRSSLEMSQTTTTSAEVQRREAELPLAGTMLTSAAEKATGVEPTGTDPLDANLAPAAGPERTDTLSAHDAGH